MPEPQEPQEQAAPEPEEQEEKQPTTLDEAKETAGVPTKQEAPLGVVDFSKALVPKPQETAAVPTADFSKALIPMAPPQHDPMSFMQRLGDYLNQFFPKPEEIEAPGERESRVGEVLVGAGKQITKQALGATALTSRALRAARESAAADIPYDIRLKQGERDRLPAMPPADVALQQLTGIEGTLEPETGPEKMGAFITEIGEWTAGEHVIGALAQIDKIAQLPRMIEMFKESPKAAKLLMAMARIARTTETGATIGTVGGAAEGDIGGGAERGAAAGAVGGSIGEVISGALGAVAKRFAKKGIEAVTPAAAATAEELGVPLSFAQKTGIGEGLEATLKELPLVKRPFDKLAGKQAPALTIAANKIANDIVESAVGESPSQVGESIQASLGEAKAKAGEAYEVAADRIAERGGDEVKLNDGPGSDLAKRAEELSEQIEPVGTHGEGFGGGPRAKALAILSNFIRTEKPPVTVPNATFITRSDVTGRSVWEVKGAASRFTVVDAGGKAVGEFNNIGAARAAVHGGAKEAAEAATVEATRGLGVKAAIKLRRQIFEETFGADMTPYSGALKQLNKALHDEIFASLKREGLGQLATDFETASGNYRDTVEMLESSVMKATLKRDPNTVAGYLLRNVSPTVTKQLRNLAGAEMYPKIQRAIWEEMFNNALAKDNGILGGKTLAKMWDQLGDETANELFGATQAQKMREFIDLVEHVGLEKSDKSIHFAKTLTYKTAAGAYIAHSLGVGTLGTGYVGARVLGEVMTRPGGVELLTKLFQAKPGQANLGAFVQSLDDIVAAARVKPRPGAIVREGEREEVRHKLASMLLDDPALTPIAAEKPAGAAAKEEWVSVERYSTPGKEGGYFYTPPGEAPPEFGDIKSTAQIDKSKLYHGTSSYDYVANDPKLMRMPIPEDVLPEFTEATTRMRNLFKHNPEIQRLLSNIKTAGDMVRVNDPGLFENTWYSVLQRVAKEDLEKKGFKGAFWSEEDDLTPRQFQVFDRSILKQETPPDPAQNFVRGFNQKGERGAIKLGESSVKVEFDPDGTYDLEDMGYKRLRNYAIHDVKTGEPIGSINVMRDKNDPKILIVDYLEGELSPQGVRDLIREMQREFPDVKKAVYKRVRTTPAGKTMIEPREITPKPVEAEEKRPLLARLGITEPSEGEIKGKPGERGGVKIGGEEPQKPKFEMIEGGKGKPQRFEVTKVKYRPQRIGEDQPYAIVTSKDSQGRTASMRMSEKLAKKAEAQGYFEATSVPLSEMFGGPPREVWKEPPARERLTSVPGKGKGPIETTTTKLSAQEEKEVQGAFDKPSSKITDKDIAAYQKRWGLGGSLVEEEELAKRVTDKEIDEAMASLKGMSEKDLIEHFSLFSVGPKRVRDALKRIEEGTNWKKPPRAKQRVLEILKKAGITEPIKGAKGKPGEKGALIVGGGRVYQDTLDRAKEAIEWMTEQPEKRMVEEYGIPPALAEEYAGAIKELAGKKKLTPGDLTDAHIGALTKVRDYMQSQQPGEFIQMHGGDKPYGESEVMDPRTGAIIDRPAPPEEGSEKDLVFRFLDQFDKHVEPVGAKSLDTLVRAFPKISTEDLNTHLGDWLEQKQLDDQLDTILGPRPQKEVTKIGDEFFDRRGRLLSGDKADVFRFMDNSADWNTPKDLMDLFPKIPQGRLVRWFGEYLEATKGAEESERFAEMQGRLEEEQTSDVRRREEKNVELINPILQEHIDQIDNIFDMAARTPRVAKRVRPRMQEPLPGQGELKYEELSPRQKIQADNLLSIASKLSEEMESGKLIGQEGWSIEEPTEQLMDIYKTPELPTDWIDLPGGGMASPRYSWLLNKIDEWKERRRPLLDKLGITGPATGKKMGKPGEEGVLRIRGGKAVFEEEGEPRKIEDMVAGDLGYMRPDGKVVIADVDHHPRLTHWDLADRNKDNFDMLMEDGGVRYRLDYDYKKRTTAAIEIASRRTLGAGYDKAIKNAIKVAESLTGIDRMYFEAIDDIYERTTASSTDGSPADVVKWLKKQLK